MLSEIQCEIGSLEGRALKVREKIHGWQEVKKFEIHEGVKETTHDRLCSLSALMTRIMCMQLNWI